jgi:hypothetical protein
VTSELKEQIQIIRKAFDDGFNAGLAFGRAQSETLGDSIRPVDRQDAWILWSMIYLKDQHQPQSQRSWHTQQLYQSPQGATPPQVPPGDKP